jgi:Flp pilus assembly protein CpaB
MPLRSIMVMLMLTTAGALGLIAYQMHNQSGAPTPVARVAAPPALIPYLVAARPLPPGTLARIEDFSPRSAPADKVPPEAIIDTPDARADLRSSLIRKYIETGAPVTQADIMRPHERGFLAAVLAPGTRAVSIAVNPVSGVAGLISPGDRVDVILTQELPQHAGQTEHLVTSETVLTNVRVIAVDQDIAQGAPTNGAHPPHTPPPRSPSRPPSTRPNGSPSHRILAYSASPCDRSRMPARPPVRPAPQYQVTMSPRHWHVRTSPWARMSRSYRAVSAAK